MNESSETASAGRIDCPPAKDPAVRWFIFAAMMIGFGVWTVYDHYVAGNYPYPEPYALNPYLKYLFNHYVPWLLLPAGLIALGAGIRQLCRKLVADEDGLAYGRGGNVRWDDVEKLDASMLQKKGIIRLQCRDERTVILDSWKIQDFRDLVAFIERHIPPDRVRR